MPKYKYKQTLNVNTEIPQEAVEPKVIERYESFFLSIGVHMLGLGIGSLKSMVSTRTVSGCPGPKFSILSEHNCCVSLGKICILEEAVIHNQNTYSHH